MPTRRATLAAPPQRFLDPSRCLHEQGCNGRKGSENGVDCAEDQLVRHSEKLDCLDLEEVIISASGITNLSHDYQKEKTKKADVLWM